MVIGGGVHVTESLAALVAVVGGGWLLGCLVEAATAQVVGDDNVGDGVEHELYVVGVGGASHVAVDFLGCGFVLSLELGLDVGGRLAVFLRTCRQIVFRILYPKFPFDFYYYFDGIYILKRNPSKLSSNFIT